MFYYENWLVWWWSLRNPTVCHLPPGSPRKLVVSFQSDSEGLRVKGVDGVSPSPRREDLTSKFSLPPSLIQALSGLDDVHPPWRGPSALLSLLNHILISSRNTLKDTFRNNVFNQISECPVAQSSWHMKLTIARTISGDWRMRTRLPYTFPGDCAFES